jgi:hypothetical protein
LIPDGTRGQAAAGRQKTLGLSRQHNEAGARKMHDHLAGARVMPADGDVL